MSSQSPQRSRKTQHAVGAASQRRDPSPSPVRSLREQREAGRDRDRQRYARTQSMPIVTGFAAASGSGSSPLAHQLHVSPTAQLQQQQQQRQPSPPSPTNNVPPQRPDFSEQTPADALRGPALDMDNNDSYHYDGFVRPVARVPVTQFLNRLPVPPPSNPVGVGSAGEWEMTDALHAEIEHADFLQAQIAANAAGPPVPGTEGVAYAGGALSFARVTTSTTTASTMNVGMPGSSPPKGSGAVDKSHATMKEDSGHASGGSTGLTGTRKPSQHQRGRDIQQQQTRGPRSGSRPLTPDNVNASIAPTRSSPTSYYPSVQAQASTPPALRRAVNNSSPLATGSPGPARALKVRTPDRSLPVQEEPDEHDNDLNTHNLHLMAISPSPAPSSDLNPDNDLLGLNNDHDGATLVNYDVKKKVDHDAIQGQSSSGDDTEAAAHTPRSPSAGLYDQSAYKPNGKDSMRSIHEVVHPEPHGKHSPGRQKDDQYAQQMQTPSFNPDAFQQTMKKLQGQGVAVNAAPNGVNLSAEMNLRRQLELQRLQQTPIYSRNDSRGSYPNWIPDYYQNYPDELEMELLDDATYMQQLQEHQQQYLPTYQQMAQHRPDAPVPPTPNGQSQGEQQQSGQHEPMPRTLIPPFSPAPPGGTPYPYPFSHLRRGYTYPTRTPGGTATGPRVTSSVYDPSVVQEQLALQMQMYAINNAAANGMVTDSTLSPSSTPYPGTGPLYTPFGAFLSQRRGLGGRGLGPGVFPGVGGLVQGENGGRMTSASIRSSPSHMPVPLPSNRGRGMKKRDRFSSSRDSGTAQAKGAKAAGETGRQRVKPPPRVESTQPRDTSPEPSSGEETAGDKYEDVVDVSLGSGEWSGSAGSGSVGRDGEENGEWIDEDSEGEHDLLDLEFHPTFVSNKDRRRKRWDQRWEELVRAFQALDRETDGTLLLLASPSHSNTLHSLQSRSIRRDASLFDSPAIHTIKSNFATVASQRRQARTRAERLSLIERLYAFSQSSGTEDGSPTSASGSSGREEDLRRALKAAIESLNMMRQMYEVRESRWREEEKRIAEEREGMEMLLTQAFGVGMSGPNGGGMGNGM